MSKPITLVQVIQHYRGMPHQTAALYELEKELALLPGYQSVMDRERPWFNTWSSAPPAKQPLLQQEGALLKVPYFSQVDNATTAADGPGWRQCASSSCAMIAAFWGKVTPDQKGEAQYIAIRQKHGETTDPMAHVATLRELGLMVEFRTTGTAERLKQELNAGQPVAVGWLHHGPSAAPRGGGHWSVVIGYNRTHYIHHDPYGEANVNGGGYVTTAVGAGRSIAYSATAWLPRWVPRGNDGWMITARAA